MAPHPRSQEPWWTTLPWQVWTAIAVLAALLIVPRVERLFRSELGLVQGDEVQVTPSDPEREACLRAVAEVPIVLPGDLGSVAAIRAHRERELAYCIERERCWSSGNEPSPIDVHRCLDPVAAINCAEECG